MFTASSPCVVCEVATSVAHFSVPHSFCDHALAEPSLFFFCPHHTRISEILQKIMVSYLILNSDGFVSHSHVLPLNFCLIGKLSRDLLGT